jgi:hypothetical protein
LEVQGGLLLEVLGDIIRKVRSKSEAVLKRGYLFIEGGIVG